MEHRGAPGSLTSSPPAPIEQRLYRWVDHGAIAVFLAWTTVHATRRVASGDVWWHMVTGRYMWETRTFLPTDLFSYAHRGAPWVNISWLADIGLYLVHQAGGVHGLAVLTTVLTVCIAVTLVAAVHRAGRSAVFIPVAVLALVLQWPRLLPRPHMLSALFTAVTMGLIESDRRKPGKRIWCLVPFASFWACCHGAFPILLALVGAYGVERVLTALRAGDDEARRKQRREAGRVLLLGAACAGATLLQPYGPAVYSRIAEMMTSQVWHGTIGEWQSTTDLLARNAQFAFRWFLLYGVLLTSFAIALPRVSVFRVLAAAGMGTLAFTAVRHLDVFLYVAVPVIVLNAHDALDRWTARHGPGSFRHLRWRRLAQWAWLGIVLVVAVRWTAQIRRGRVWVDGRAVRARAWGISPYAFPETAVAQLRAHPTGGRVFNSFGHGGYISWHQYPEPVFIDGKGLDERQLLAFESARASPQGWPQLIATYDVRAVVMPTAPSAARLFAQLAADPAWQLECFDAGGYLYTRRTVPVGIEPAPIAGSATADRVAVPIGTYPRLDPAGARSEPAPVSAIRLGAFWAAAEMPNRALAAYDEGMQTHPNAVVLRLRFAELLLRLREPVAAAQLVQDIDKHLGRARAQEALLIRTRAAHASGRTMQALTLARGLRGRTVAEAGYQLRVQLLSELGDLPNAQAEGERWVRAYGNSPEARNNLAVVLSLRKDFAGALQIIDETIRRAPDRGDLRYTRSLILDAQGDRAAAQAALAEAARLGFTPDAAP